MLPFVTWMGTIRLTCHVLHSGRQTLVATAPPKILPCIAMQCAMEGRSAQAAGSSPVAPSMISPSSFRLEYNLIVYCSSLTCASENSFEFSQSSLYNPPFSNSLLCVPLVDSPAIFNHHDLICFGRGRNAVCVTITVVRLDPKVPRASLGYLASYYCRPQK